MKSVPWTVWYASSLRTTSQKLNQKQSGFVVFANFRFPQCVNNSTMATPSYQRDITEGGIWKRWAQAALESLQSTTVPQRRRCSGSVLEEKWERFGVILGERRSNA